MGGRALEDPTNASFDSLSTARSNCFDEFDEACFLVDFSFCLLTEDELEE
jgi:hypothetical protein